MRLYGGISELRTAGRKRLRDARTLLSTGEARHARGSAYLAGYAVECRLKAIAMEIFRCQNLEELAIRWRVSAGEVYHHKLERFARRLPLWNRLQKSPVQRSFAAVNGWCVFWRYDGRDWTVAKARAFYDNVVRVLEWLDKNL
jgi:hypothetical protein